MDDRPLDPDQVIRCPSCDHRLKLKGGKLVNLGIGASHESLSVSTALAEKTEKRARTSVRKDARTTQTAAQEPQDAGDDSADPAAPAEAEEDMLLAMSQRKKDGDTTRARRMVRESTRRHQQTAVVWLLAGTIFVVLAVGFIVLAGPDRFSNVYRPKQLAAGNNPSDPTADPTQMITEHGVTTVTPHPSAALPSGGQLTAATTPQASPADSTHDSKRGSIFTAPLQAKDYPPVEAQPLYTSPWREPTEPFAPYDGLTQISLQNNAIIDEDHGQRRYLADLVYDGQDTIETLTVYLGLVDETEQVIARMAIPLGLLNYTHPQRINVTIPQPYAQRTRRVIWGADIGKKVAGGIPIGRIVLQPTGAETNAALLINAVNPVNLPVGRASFLLVAHNDQGRPVMRWRVDWNQHIEPSQGFYLKAITPVQRVWQAKHWVATGVAYPALPAAAAPTQ